MDIKEAEKIIEDSQNCIAEIKQIRCQTLAQKSEAESRIEKLKENLGVAMVAEKLGQLTFSEVNEIRTEVQQVSGFLREFPYLLRGLDLRQAEELERRKEPVCALQDEQERRQQDKEYLSLQEDLIRRAGHTAERDTDSFKRLVKKYQALSRSLGKEGSADKFLRRQSL